jgi:very-short-patch-repair endonuclease
VLADAVTAEPRLVIEFDDRSHTRPDARRREALKDAALAAAGLPLLRVAVATHYDPGKLSGIIAHVLALGS